MLQPRHSKKISVPLVAMLTAATSSITISSPASLAQDKNDADKKAIAAVAGTQSKAVDKKPVASKSVNPRLQYPRTHFEKAYYFKQKHDLNNALIEFLKSTQENPLLVRAFYEQALIFRERGYLKLAAASLEQALAVKPDYQDARILLATISIQQGNVGGAVRQLTRSLGLENAIIKNDSQPNAPAQIVKKMVGEKVKDIDAAVDLAPSVILQSIHTELKYQKTLDSEPEAQEPTKEEQQTQTETAVAETKTDESNNKHFDLASIKDSLRDSFETAIHAPFSLATYWNHLPFGNPQLSEKASEEKATGELAEKNSDQNNEDDSKKRKKKKRKKKERKHKKSESSESDSKKSVEQLAETATATVKNDSTDTTSALPDFVQKAIAEHKEAQETALAAAQPQLEQNKTLFASTDFSQSTHSLINGLKPTENAKEAEPPKPEPVHIDTDEWAVKLKELVEHGTNSLKEGEAFMFAEDTGEASLFLADGRVIRRIVQAPRDQVEIVRQRRPDMLIPDDLLYKLSLLGKLIPHPENTATQSGTTNQNNISNIPATTAGTVGATSAQNDFKVDNVMGESQNFWGWLKNAFKF